MVSDTLIRCGAPICSAIGALVLVIIGIEGVPTLAAEPPCDKVVDLLATKFVYGVPNSRLARVEIRQCTSQGSDTLQIVAWRNGELRPGLVVDTGDFGVVQAAARRNVFVVETAGAARDQVFVISYIRGIPELALKQVIRGTARVSITPSSVDLVIEGIYAGDAPPKTESHRFALIGDEGNP